MIKLKRQKVFAQKKDQLLSYVKEPRAHTSENGSRYYDVGNDSFPSITSILGYFKKRHIMEWKERIGVEEANKITARASRRGTTIHNMVESYLKNEDMDTILDRKSPIDIETFKNLLPTLSSIDNIFLQEQALYSETLKIAGRCDLGAEFDGVPSIIDFKTSLREKKEEYIQDYFEQATAYSLMWSDMTGKDISQIVIIIANDECSKPQVFKSNVGYHGASLLAKIEEFRKHMG